MNITETENAPATLRIEPQQPAREVKTVARAERETSRNQAQAEQPQDRFIQQPEMAAARGALYNVTDVRRRGGARIANRLQEGEVVLSGSKVGEKLIDIILTPGVKKLEIYRTEKSQT